ncbi:MAG: right-handed parallel beta-helix repeat-containing protein [Chloroflexi bacterium]|nr:right-handed parallel beta-helix repeat-containing protein [Chloroflexota bacterium]
MARAAFGWWRLRRLLGVLLVLLLVVTQAVPRNPLSPPDALALTRTGNLWTVSPGVASEIQPAIDAARDNGGGSVRLPAAVYLLTLKVRVHSDVILYGDGMDQTILRWAPGATLDHMMSNGSLTAGNANLQIWNMTLDGQSIPSGRTDCCFGLRLNNVQNSYVVNVAADGHSKDGIYIGYNQSNGAQNVRVSNCRANNNARNGISLIHGNNNIIDHCQVLSNNRGEAVAGIDVEPDQGLSVTNSKIVANTANSQNVGIQLFVQHNGYATSYHNAVCYNSASGNTSAGVYDYRSDQNIFVDNLTSANGTNFSVDDSALIGSAYASYCQLPALPSNPGLTPTATPTVTRTPTATLTPTVTQTPTVTPTPTRTVTPTPSLTPTPRPSCTPRPAVTVTTTRGATTGTLNVTVTVTRPAAAPNNTVQQLQFGPAQNATIEIGGQQHPGGNFSVPIPPGVQQATFTVRRQTAGQAATAPFAVVDDCGAWQTFVGGGPGAF